MNKISMEKILRSIVILVDTREKKNLHILNWFIENNIKYKNLKLDFGDYSFMIPKDEEIGVTEDVIYKDKIAIERKNSLNEISGNFTRGRERFAREFKRAKEKGCDIRLVIEEADYSDIDKGKYSKMNPKSMKGSIHSFDSKFDLPVVFIPKEYTGDYIYNRFYYWLRNKLEK